MGVQEPRFVFPSARFVIRAHPLFDQVDQSTEQDYQDLVLLDQSLLHLESQVHLPVPLVDQTDLLVQVVVVLVLTLLVVQDSVLVENLVIKMCWINKLELDHN